MSLKLKVAIASAGSLVFVAALCLLFLMKRGMPERRAPQSSRAASKPAVAARSPKAVKKAKPAVPSPAPRKAEAPPAAVPVPAEGGWQITGRIIRDDDNARTIVPIEGVNVQLKPQAGRKMLAEVLPRGVVTGPDGHFDLERVPGKHWMRIEIDEPSSAFRVLSLRLGEPQGDSNLDLGDIVLQPATTLSIQLIGPAGEPARGGRVLVRRSAPMRSPVLASFGITESRLEAAEKTPGTYVLVRAALGSHHVQAVAPGCAEGRGDVELPRKEPLVLHLAEGRRIAGKVLTTEGAAIAKATIEVLAGPGARELAPGTTTDEAGRFDLDTLAQGEFVIGVEAEGFASTRLRNIASGREDLEVVLEAGAVLAGNVVAEADGKPVVKAEVTLRDREGGTFSGSSDQKGKFRAKGMGAGTYTLTARHPDFAPASEGSIEFLPGQRIEDHVIRLSTGFAAAGRVVDSDGGGPVANAQVFLTAQGRQGGTKNARTNAEGAFEVKGLSEGRLAVRASARGYLRSKQQTVDLAAAAARDLTIALERGGSISGRVLDPDGRAIVGALVQPSMLFTTSEEWNEALESISNVTLRTDSEGRYRIEGLPVHGSYLVKASSASFVPSSSRGISVGPREDVGGVDLTLRRGSAIRGRVADSKGVAIAGAKIQAQEEMEEELLMVYTAADAMGKETRTDSDGSYALSPLKAGVYKVTARARDHSSSRRESIEVAEGRTVEGMDFILDDGELLAGRVVDADSEDSNGIAAVEVNVQGATQARTRTDNEGRFRIAGLRAGSVTLQVHKSGFKEAQLELALPGSEATVKLHRLARIAGRLQAKGRDSFPGFQVIALPQGGDQPEPQSFAEPSQNDPTGRFEIEVGPGTYVLQATVPGFAPNRSKPVTVKAGELNEEVVIELAAGGTVKGAVVARGTGTPIAGAHVKSRGDEVQPWHGFAPAEAKTGADGSFTLEGVPEKFTLIASHEKYAQAVVADLSVLPGGSASVKVEMGVGGGIRGTVTRGGAPADGALVQAVKQGGIGSMGKQTRTDLAGRFEMAELPAGEYLLIFSGRDGLSSRRVVVVADGEVAAADITVGAGLRLFGRVTSGGAPIAGGSISAGQPEKGGAREWQSPIDASGEYSLEILGPGAYMITIQAGGRGGLSGARVDVTVPEGVPEYRKDIDLPRGGLSGVVTDAETAEPIRSRVTAYAGGPGPAPFVSSLANMRGWAETDAAGRFDISNLAPGRYSLRASAVGHADGGLDGLEVGVEGDVPEVEIALESGIAFGARVVDERGQPVPNAAVFLRDQRGHIVRAGEPARSREDGLLELSGFRPGTYRMTVVHRAYAPSRATVRAAPGAEPVVTLRLGGAVNVAVETRQGVPVEGAAIELLEEGGESILEAALFLSFLSGGGQLRTKADGAFVLEQVPVGMHRIAATTDAGRSREERIQVKAGETTEVRLMLE